jgi:hypothetical protein
MSLSGVLVDRGRVWSFTAILDAGDPGSPAIPGDPDAVPPVLPVDEVPPTAPARVKVEGETQMEWQAGEWFACRIDSPEAAEAEDAAGGRVRTDQHRALIYDLEDESGAPVVLTADSRVEVVSEELGTATYELSGQPTLYRKKTDLIAGQAALKLVLNFPVLVEAAP